MNDDQYADLRGRLDAAEAVLLLLLAERPITLKGEDTLKAEILRYSQGLRKLAHENPLSLAQADAMDRYANRVRTT